MSNRWKTQYVSRKNLKTHLNAGGQMMAGQYDEDGRCLFPTGQKSGKFLRGDNVNPRFNKCYKAKKQGHVLPHEPQQFNMMVSTIPTNKLEAMVRIGQFDLNVRRGIQV